MDYFRYYFVAAAVENAVGCFFAEPHSLQPRLVVFDIVDSSETVANSLPSFDYHSSTRFAVVVVVAVAAAVAVVAVDYVKGPAVSGLLVDLVIAVDSVGLSDAAKSGSVEGSVASFAAVVWVSWTWCVAAAARVDVHAKFAADLIGYDGIVFATLLVLSCLGRQIGLSGSVGRSAGPFVADVEGSIEQGFVVR
jgi:hypothetical protein